MKCVNRVISLVLILLFVISLCSCYYRNASYDDIHSYYKCFGIGEFLGTSGIYLIVPRCNNENWNSVVQDALVAYGYDPENNDITPPIIEDINVISFFCEETEYIAGSTNIEFLLSVKYDPISFNCELDRLSKIKGTEKIVYDTENFIYPAYVSILGFLKTNQYVLIDEPNNTLHYIYLQFCSRDDMKKIPEDFLPFGFYGQSQVQDIGYSIFH